MGQPDNNKERRKKHVRLQQYTISICCLALMVFIMIWVINVALSGKEIQTANTPVSQSEQSEADESSASETESQSDNSDDTSSETSDVSSEAVDTSSEADAETSSDDTDNSDSLAETSESESSAENTDDSSQIVIDDDFADAVFIGDSRTVGLGMNTDRPKATFYAATGLNVQTIETNQTIRLDNGSYGTVYDALKQRQFRRVYIMFGINELGWPYPDAFQEMYEGVINKVKGLQPDATVYVQSVLPVSSLALNTNSVYTNENIDNFNVYVRNAAENTGSVYLDVASALKDENGALPLEASTDGIHLMREYCMIWMEYLAENS